MKHTKEKRDTKGLLFLFPWRSTRKSKQFYEKTR